MSTESATARPENEEVWKAIFYSGHPQLRSFQKFHKSLPPRKSTNRCRLCSAPFDGIGGFYMRLRGKGPSNRNPKYCSACNKFLRTFPGGAEVELSMMFVDVRGSVPLAERMAPAEYSRYLADFFQSATQALIDTDGFVMDLRGDCVVGVFPPGLCGENHASKVVEAARHLLRDITPKVPDGSPLPIGVGATIGEVYIGTLSGAEGGIQDITILGDNVNVAARLSQVANPGEALISEALCKASGLPIEGLEVRQVELKGRSAKTVAYVMRGSAM
jgi:adenylate cyclase